MNPTDRDRLREIKTFPSLVKYLRDDLDWPIETDNFEDLVFDYEAEEFGIDLKTAAKIESIKQLRPFTTRQPWGIFFVKFTPKNLPVVALRRILGQLVLKKRASAKRSEQATWLLNDLLFISNYGEGDQRQINLAHFAENSVKGDLPTLKVLGWDGENTNLHLDHVADELKGKLKWPDDEDDIERWRSGWSSAFTLRHRETITTSKELAIRLAELARGIRKRANRVLEVETEDGPLRKLMAAFREALIHDLDDDGFADMYAQTIAYGLLSARVSRPPDLVADDVANMIPITNPFLQELMETFLNIGGRKRDKTKGRLDGIDFDELGVSDVVETLRDANMEDVLRDFGDKNPSEDPVIPFYEQFLKEYDAKKRMQRGVYYTPRPVISFIVRSVDEILHKEFDLEDGLADTTTWGEMAERHKDLEIPKQTKPDDSFVRILDPATGTGTFLVEVIDLIHKTMTEKWRAEGHGAKKIEQLWNDYVPKHLLPRLHGYELMMAPYAIAHMKVGLKLFETGYRFGSNERARIYLTNSLEPSHDLSDQLEFMAPALAHEAQAVNAIKSRQRFTVVIGNPPYAGHSSNTGEWITQLVGNYYFVDGKPLGEKNPKWLQDDYVKFIRLGEHCITQAGWGVHSYITNHGYIDNPTFRGMRHHLMRSFGAIDVLDLHGNSTKKERCPDGSEDVNVFDIKQGVAIFAARRLSETPNALTSVRHAHLFGLREKKYEALQESTFLSRHLSSVRPISPFNLFLPEDLNLRAEYSEGLRITQVMPVNVLGFQTHRDHFAIDFDRATLAQRIGDFRATKMTDVEVTKAFNICDNRDWHVKDARKQLRNDPNWKDALILCSYRPFDSRPCYFSTIAMDYPRREMLDHVDGKENLCLGLGRQGIAVQDPIWSLVWISRNPIDANVFRRGGINVFPLYLYPQEGDLSLHESRRPNFAPSFLKMLSEKLSLKDKNDIGYPFGNEIEKVVYYAYAIFHSLDYRRRYAEFLKIDFPRLPVTGSLQLFLTLSCLGEELVALHLMESPKLDKHITKLVGGKHFQVEKITRSDQTVWIDKAQTTGFRGVPEKVWNFHIGGYQVCEKWLKDRRGRVLSDEDINHYQKIVGALNETIRLMDEIDKIIEEHGGWPSAFITGGKKGKESGEESPVQQSEVINPGPKPNTKLISIGNNLFYCLSCKKETTSTHQC